MPTDPTDAGHLETATGEMCVDCLMLLANGDTPPEMSEDETDAYLAEVDRRTAGYLPVPACSDECEGGFGSHPCDVCGSTLGGDRHPVHFLPLPLPAPLPAPLEID